MNYDLFIKKNVHSLSKSSVLNNEMLINKNPLGFLKTQCSYSVSLEKKNEKIG